MGSKKSSSKKSKKSSKSRKSSSRRSSRRSYGYGYPAFGGYGAGYNQFGAYPSFGGYGAGFGYPQTFGGYGYPAATYTGATTNADAGVVTDASFAAPVAGYGAPVYGSGYGAAYPAFGGFGYGAPM